MTVSKSPENRPYPRELFQPKDIEKTSVEERPPKSLEPKPFPQKVFSHACLLGIVGRLKDADEEQDNKLVEELNSVLGKARERVRKGERVELAGVLDRDALKGKNLSGVDLSSSNLRGRDLSGSRLAETDLGNTDLTEVVLDKAFMRQANLRMADMTNTSLKEADLGGVDLRFAYNFNPEQQLKEASNLTGIKY